MVWCCELSVMRSRCFVNRDLPPAQARARDVGGDQQVAAGLVQREAPHGEPPLQRVIEAAQRREDRILSRRVHLSKRTDTAVNAGSPVVCEGCHVHLFMVCAEAHVARHVERTVRI